MVFFHYTVRSHVRFFLKSFNISLYKDVINTKKQVISTISVALTSILIKFANKVLSYLYNAKFYNVNTLIINQLK